MAYSSAVCVPRGFKPAKKNLLGILGIGGAPEPLHPLATPIQCRSETKCSISSQLKRPT